LSSQTQEQKLHKAASDFAPHIIPNIGLLRGLARVRGVKLGDFTDTEILMIIRDACQIALNGVQTFTFKPVYAK
jgi:hypothetical protein